MKTCQVHYERQRHRNGTSPQLSRHTHRRSDQNLPYVTLSMFARKGRRKVEYRRELLPVVSYASSPVSRAKTKRVGGMQVPERLGERVWCTKFQLPLRNIYFRLSGFKFSLLPIFFRYGPKGCSHAGEEWPWQKPISINFKISAP